MIRGKLGKSIVGERNIFLINSTKNRVSLYDKDNRKLLCKHSFVYEKITSHLTGVYDILNVCPKCIEIKHGRDEDDGNDGNGTSGPTKKRKENEEDEDGEVDLEAPSEGSSDRSDEEGEESEVDLEDPSEWSSDRGDGEGGFEDDEPNLELPLWLRPAVERHYEFTKDTWEKGKPEFLEVRKSDYGGRGIFVRFGINEVDLYKNNKLYQNDPLGTYKGLVIWDPPPKDEDMSDSIIEFRVSCQKLWVDGRIDETVSYWAALINHKWDWPYPTYKDGYSDYCQYFANVEFDETGEFRLIRHLKDEEELGWDYGMEYWGFRETRKGKKTDGVELEKEKIPFWNFSKNGINIDFENFIKINPELIELALVSKLGPISRGFNQFIKNEKIKRGMSVDD